MKRPGRPRALALALLLGLALDASALAGCEKAAPEPPYVPRPSATPEPVVPEPPDLIQQDLVVGTGAEAKDGDKVTVNYSGRLLKTNFMFDTSIGPGKKPFPFQIGKGGVIKGWEQGVVGMKVGGKRKLTIPSRLGYGAIGSSPKIPPNATLVFEIELLTVGEPADAGADGAADSPDAGKKKKKAP